MTHNTATILAFLASLLHRAAMVVEYQHPLGRAGHIGHDEPTRGHKSPGCHSTFATTRRGALVHDPAW